MQTKLTILATAALSFLTWGTVRIVQGITFTQGCGGHLKRAADANTIALAEAELATAVAYMESNRLTDGYTSVLWRTPDEDVGFWYDNLSASLGELRQTDPDASPLERSNMLMKLRETLMHGSSEGGSSVTAPDGITIYPNNTAFFLWAWGSVLVVCFTGGSILWEVS